MSKEKFGYCVNNLRSIRDMKLIDLKKINILVGKNSVGKSSFLRSLWLIKRSLSNRSGAPIMWYGGRGDDVDFGDFSSSKCSFSSDDNIRFKFRIGNLARVNKKADLLSRNFALEAIFCEKLSVNDILIDVSIVERGGKTRKSKFFLSFVSNGIKREVVIEYEDNYKGFLPFNVIRNYSVKEIEEDGKRIGKENAPTEFGSDPLNFLDVSDSLFPNLLPILVGKDSFETFADVYDCAERQVRQFARKYAHGNVIDVSAVIFPLLAFMVKGEIDKDDISYLLNRHENAKWARKFYEKILNDGGDLLEQLNVISLQLFTSLLIDRCGDYVTEIIGKTIMIGPLRANAERFYRVHDLQTSSIESDGSNLAMWLHSLSDINLKDFSSFVYSIFGYGVDLVRDRSNISIVVQKDNTNVNIVDTGFGISQMLPVLSAIWLSARGQRQQKGKSRKSAVTIALVEQPELHLHPAYQARLADAFVEALRSGNQDVRFIIETHSEAIINRLGHLIRKKMINEDDVQILVFNESNDSESDRSARIELASYDGDGVLSGWPYGFFNWTL